MNRSAPVPVATLVLVFAAACDAPPTAPVVPDAPATLASHGSNHGNGATFLPQPLPATLVPLVDEDGDVCEITFNEQDDSHTRSDWNRTNPDGSVSLHVTDRDATFDIVHGGTPYTGVGQAVVVASTNAEGTAFEQIVVNSTAKVVGPDGETHHARCRGRVDETGLSIDAEVVVR